MFDAAGALFGATLVISCYAWPELARLYHSGGSAQISVAVLDGPVDGRHPCFNGADLIYPLGAPPSCSASPGPAISHGTHIASILFGQPFGSFVGLIPRCRGLIIPVFFDDGDRVSRVSQLDLANAILAALEAGAQFINISAGELAHNSDAQPALVDALDKCISAGTLVLAAAGNDGCECLHFPAALSTVMAIGATDNTGLPLPVSNWGPHYSKNGLPRPR